MNKEIKNESGNGDAFLLQTHEITSNPTASDSISQSISENNRSFDGEEIPSSSLRVVDLIDATLSDNTSQVGFDVMSGENLRIGSHVTMLDGLYLRSFSVIPTITRHLSTDSVIQLETSPYLTADPSGTPIVIANSSVSLFPQDAAAFRVPTEGFVGWSPRLGNDGTQVVLSPDIYKISYENVKGAENPNPRSYTVVTPSILLIDLPILPAYRFLGWFDAPEGGNRVTEIPQGSIGDKTLYAQWEIIVYTITYYGNDEEGEPAENIPLPQSVLEGESVILSDESPTRTGFLFLSWNTASDGTGADYRPEEVIANVTADIDLYAQWQSLPPSEHVLSYHPNDEGGAAAYNMPDDIAIPDGDDAHISPQIPTREGFAFVVWNTDPSGSGAAYAPRDVVSEVKADIDLYAQWSPIHTVTYYGNDIGGMPAQGIPEPITVPEGQSFPLSYKIPTRPGYRFTSWNTSSKGIGVRYFPGQTVDAITSDLNLYAQWLYLPPNYFRVCFIQNIRCSCEVCGMPPPMKVRERHTARIPFCKPCRPFCRFIGWNTRADGCGSWYASGQSIFVDRNLTLFAQWR